MGLLKGICLIALIAWIVMRVKNYNRVQHLLGNGVPVFNHSPGQCKVFHVNGSEDIDVLPSGLAVFSSGVFFRINLFGVDPRMYDFEGILYYIDLSKPIEAPKRIRIENFHDPTFKPHGLDFYTDPKTKEVTMFLINHSGGKNTIEIFQVDEENVSLKHKKTVVSDKIYFPNDIVGVGPEQFYVVNDHYFNNHYVAFLETLFSLRLGNTVLCDGSDCKYVAGNIYLAAGINIDNSEKYVFVASALGGDLHVYERTHGNDLIERQRLHIGVGLDNIVVDENGDLLIGLINSAIEEFNRNFTKSCPGKVIKIKLREATSGNGPFEVAHIQEIFASSGDGDFRGSSTAVVHGNKMLIGTPFHNIMYCEVAAF